MSNRYQTHTFVTASIAPGVSLTINRTGLPSLFNIQKVKVVPDQAGGTYDFKIFKSDTFAAAKLLAHWDNVPGISLYDPIDNTNGLLTEALEGSSIPYDDDDGTGELHAQVTNNSVGARVYTVTITYEEVPVMSATGAAGFRNTITATTATANYGILHTDGVITFGTWIGLGASNPLAGGWIGTQSVHNLYLFTGDGGAKLTISAATGMVTIGNTVEVYSEPGLTLAIGHHYIQNNSTFNALTALRSPNVYWSLFKLDPNDIFTINPDFADMDVIIKSRTNNLHYKSDAGALGGVGVHGFGSVDYQAFVNIEQPIMTADPNPYGAFRFIVDANFLWTIPTGVRPVVASIGIAEPNFTKVGVAVEDAVTLYVGGAPTEALRNAAIWVAGGDVVIGTAALATNATIGFLHIPSCAGVPTGVPANVQAGTMALCGDRTNNKLYIHSGGAWVALN